MMTNSELQDAITAANAMVKATGQDSRTYAPLLEHLHALLKLQQQRAEHPGRCAQVCDEIAAQAWALWKLGADPTDQGRCIGAEQCAQAIRATIPRLLERRCVGNQSSASEWGNTESGCSPQSQPAAQAIDQ